MERSHRTDEEEFYRRPGAEERIKDWDFGRPHTALNGLTPATKLHKTLKGKKLKKCPREYLLLTVPLASLLLQPFCSRIYQDYLKIDVSFVASLPNYRTESPHTKSIPPIYFMDALAAVNFQPTDYVDISELIEEKGKALLCHQSQYRWLLDHDGIDYIDFMKKHSAFRGVQCGVKYAEAFQRYAVWGRIHPGSSLP